VTPKKRQKAVIWLQICKAPAFWHSTWLGPYSLQWGPAYSVLFSQIS